MILSFPVPLMMSPWCRQDLLQSAYIQTEALPASCCMPRGDLPTGTAFQFRNLSRCLLTFDMKAVCPRVTGAIFQLSGKQPKQLQQYQVVGVASASDAYVSGGDSVFVHYDISFDNSWMPACYMGSIANSTSFTLSKTALEAPTVAQKGIPRGGNAWDLLIVVPPPTTSKIHMVSQRWPTKSSWSACGRDVDAKLKGTTTSAISVSITSITIEWMLMQTNLSYTWGDELSKRHEA
ncbi:hypothetical protein BKA82DRAFT_4428086 [Pisolithus tinctorius]|nr:hypothetical protein BKA82DRAFT_4428086 [Pisolithus tinctorius]